jgi:hypothetical protein
MGISALPFGIVALSSTAYSLLLSALRRSNVLGGSSPSARGPVKLISSGHAVVSSSLAFYFLYSSQWHRFPTASARSTRTLGKGGNLDDSANPLIQGRSAALNALTAWEAGYLIYDTYALAASSYATTKPSLHRALSRLARVSPAILAHHILLSAALLYLQLVIARNRERGVWVIVAFMLMNASTLILHARWWATRHTRNTTLIRMLDVVLAISFPATRICTVAWVLKCYENYHGLGPWEVYKRLRVQCQAGTGALVVLNSLWWFMLVKEVVKRHRRNVKSG